jgi:hypothetical protein
LRIEIIDILGDKELSFGDVQELATRLKAIMTGHYDLERIYFPLPLLP